MNPSIRDDELVLFHYRDGLSVARRQEIAAALAGDASLRARLVALERLLDAVDDISVPAADAGYEARLWQQLQPRLDPALPQVRRQCPAQPGAVAARRRRRWVGGAAAAALLALAVGIVPRPLPTPGPSMVADPGVVPALTLPTAPKASGGIIDDAVAAHLRRTEAMLVGVLNNDQTHWIEGSDGQARVLLDDNRLFVAAAARRGDRRLAVFLDSLEPVLLELANQTPDTGIQLDQEGMRDVVRNTDLLFQLRAVEAGLKASERQRV